MNQFAFLNNGRRSAVATADLVGYVNSTSTTPATGYVSVAPVSRSIQHEKGKKDAIDSAVYSHIQALRALGVTRLNTTEIARSLNLSTGSVNEAVKYLKDKGVKIA